MARPTGTIRLAALGMALTSVLGQTGAAAQAPLFEVERSDAKLLRVNDDAGFVVGGTLEAGGIPATGAGIRLMWYPRKAALRAGVASGTEWDDANIGVASVALGFSNTASGGWSTAIGANNAATGSFSFAGGSGARAEGQNAVALGNNPVASGAHALATGSGSIASGTAAVATGIGTRASGTSATAMGSSSVASGHSSTAMGLAAIASGDGSVAMGTHAVAQGTGSFAFADRSSTGAVTAFDNQFLVRAHGGIGFNTGTNIGCDLPPGSGAWQCTSSRLAKEGFEDVDGEAVLAQLAGIRIQRWRYIGGGAAHIGPTAEDFRAAFGLGEGSTRIATLDANGVALRAVQALERRTADLRQLNAVLQGELETLRARIEALTSRPQPSPVGR
jgi:trimeric autotransporter adhesin